MITGLRKAFNVDKSTSSDFDIESVSKAYSEIKELRNEVQKQHLENTKILLEAQKTLEISKSEITETAMNKSLEIMLHVKHWMYAIMLVIAVGGFLGYQSFFSSLNAYMKERVEDWLRFDVKESEARKNLDELRTQALLDAHTIRYARSLSSPFGINSHPLEESEIKRLVEIVVNVDSSYSDFADALRLITRSRSPFVLARPEDEVGRQLTAILQSREYGNDKKVLLLEYMSKEEALMPYSKQMLADESIHESIKLRVLENVAFFERDLAVEFARNNFESMDSLFSKSNLAGFLAENDHESKLIYDYLNWLLKEQPEDWTYHFASPFSELLVNETARKYDLVKDLLSSSIEFGLSTELSDVFRGPRYLSITFGGTVVPIKDPNNLFSDREFVSQTLVDASDDIDLFARALNFFQIKDGSHYLTTVLLDLKNQSSVLLKNKGNLPASEIVGHLWLRLEKVAGAQVITATWRDNLGEVHSDELIDSKGLNTASYHISFDSKALEDMSIREYNKDFRTW